MNTLHLIGLKITQYDSTAKCVSILRKFIANASISDLRSKMNNGEYVLSCECSDHAGVRKVNRCYKELVKAGIKVEIYQSDELIPYQLLLNLIGSHRQTENEVAKQMYDEADD